MGRDRFGVSTQMILPANRSGPSKPSPLDSGLKGLGNISPSFVTTHTPNAM